MPVVHNAMMLIKPSSVNVTGVGSSATINDSGSVTFSSCESLSLNNVFSSVFDNYVVYLRHRDDGTTSIRLRRNSADDSTASSYTYQLLDAQSTTVAGARSTSTLAPAAYGASTSPNGNTLYIFGPALNQPTAGRSVNVNNIGSARLTDWAWTHNQSVSYDGFTLLRTSTAQTMHGDISVYGLRQ